MKAIIKVYRDRKQLYEIMCGSYGSLRKAFDNVWTESNADKVVIIRIKKDVGAGTKE